MGLEVFGAIVIAVAVIVGCGAHLFTKKVDSPAEQVAEAVLRSKGIDIDFSAYEKQEQNNKAQDPKSE